MKDENILVTGATGAFGKYLFQELLSTGCQVTALVRAESNDAAKKRLAPYIDEQDSARVTVLSADLTKVDLGLSNHTYSELHQSITAVIHAAASTRFDLSLAEARRSNVTTLKNILGFVHGSKHLAKFGYVSTAFVAGKKSGLIPEAELDSNEGFVNSYDQTKFEAEEVVRSKMHDLPTAIYRPSLIVAPDSNSHHAAVVVLSLVKKGLLPVMPGVPEDVVDLVSADYASKTIASLFSNHFKAGETYHVVSGKQAPTLGEIVALAKQPHTNTKYTGHDSHAYDMAVSELLNNQPALQPIYQKVDCFIKYLCYPKTFADNNALQALQESVKSYEVINILKSLIHE